MFQDKHPLPSPKETKKLKTWLSDGDANPRDVTSLGESNKEPSDPKLGLQRRVPQRLKIGQERARVVRVVSVQSMPC